MNSNWKLQNTTFIMYQYSITKKNPEVSFDRLTYISEKVNAFTEINTITNVNVRQENTDKDAWHTSTMKFIEP